MLRHLRLHEQCRRAGADAGRQPIHRHIHDMLGKLTGLGIIGGQRMPVDDAEEAVVLVLQLDPVLQHAVIVPKVQTTARTHP